MFIHLDLQSAIEVAFLGFMGGVLSGFIGTGGAFIMTPGMMNLGVPGLVAVGSNIAHKFGKSIVGARRHGELGHVDRKLGFFMLITAVLGIRLAVWLNKYFAEMEIEGVAGVAGDLYISVLFVVVLSVISIPMLIEAVGHDRRTNKASPVLTDLLSRVGIPPLVYFPVADVKLSFWLVAIVGLLTGFLAGSIGVGGFLGVPAMIYLFGVPTAVAAGTELFLAAFMGAWGAINYAWNGLVDLRLVFLLYLGSLTGIHIGTYGTKVVQEHTIRLITGLIIFICVISRGVIIPVYLHEIGSLELSAGAVTWLSIASKVLLFASGTVGVAVVLFHVIRAYRRGHTIRKLVRHGRV